MRSIYLSDFKKEDLVNGEALIEAYKNYLMEELGDDEWDAQNCANEDMSNPYDAPFVIQEYEGCVEIDGVSYEVRRCRTNYCMVGLFHLDKVKPFEFYMLLDQSEGTYSEESTMYVV